MPPSVERAIDQCFHSNNWHQDIKDARGFAYFKDASLWYVVMHDYIKMEVIVRDLNVPFDLCIEEFAKQRGWADNTWVRGPLCTQASWCDPWDTGNLTAFALSQLKRSNSVPPGSCPTIGRVIAGGKIVRHGDEPNKHFIARFRGVSWSGDCFKFGAGNPPSPPPQGSADNAVGGIGGAIIKGNKITEENAWYKAQNETGRESGKLIIAHESRSHLLVVVIQRDGIAGFTLDEIRDKLYEAGMVDAVFLDGSDSVMLYLNHEWEVRQGPNKNYWTDIGLCFQYPYWPPEALVL